MKRHRSAIIGIGILAATLCSTVIWSQADPEWLKSWNEALENKPAKITSEARIASANEAGIPLVIHGRVFTPDNTAAAGILVHAYHRDQDGLDFGPNDESVTTWRLQGWAKTDANGRFKFQTIRPAPDHLGREGAHIHFTLESDDYGRQWAPTVFLSDDPLVPSHHRERSKKAGDFAWVRDVRIGDGIQHVDVKFKLKEKGDFR